MPEVSITNSVFTRAKAKMFGAALTVEARVDKIIFDNVTLSDSQAAALGFNITSWHTASKVSLKGVKIENNTMTSAFSLVHKVLFDDEHR